MSGRAGAAALAAALAAAAGCGGGGDPAPTRAASNGTVPETYAAIPRRDVRRHARIVAANAVQRAGGSFQGHELRLRRLETGRNSEGRRAWQVRFRDATARRDVCVWLWGGPEFPPGGYDAEVGFCRRGEPPTV